ncbi:MAG TPA: protein translocase subunit SecF [Anaerolineae bacterium]|nr:protein translocase subunit SecF [Anaerolineae bacterium]
MFDIVGKRHWYFLISACVIGLGLASMVYSTVRFGTPVRLSVDFAGGSRFLLKFEGPATEDAIRQVFANHGFGNPIVNRLEDAQGNVLWQVRTKKVKPEEAEALYAELAEKIAPLDRGQSTLDSVSPAIGEEVTRAATLAVVTASVVILGFIVIAFRRVPKAFRYGTCAIASLIHDILVALGFFSIMGLLRGWEVDALFLTAILTVLGFSVQDTIVVFDRIRENIPKRRGEPFETIVNRSILETIHRSLATQLNAMFVMIAILLFGGGTVKQFVATMLVGMLSGTYSSIFTAVPLLVVWEKGEVGQIFRRLRGRAAA